ncbi:hypothetical protein HYW17_04785 [Candidatus Uhrbacteria bacterium]|nr:hypothetical protein [Candidatus Uhrbacteria bacterium]
MLPYIQHLPQLSIPQRRMSAMAMKQKQIQVLGEQLTGLSPTVCRRAIAAMRRVNAEWKESCDAPAFYNAMAQLLHTQVGIEIEFCIRRPNAEQLAEHLRMSKAALVQCELFLDIIEGIEHPEASPPADPSAK